MSDQEKHEFTEKLDQISKQQRWFIGISLGILVTIISGGTAIGIASLNNRENIQKINDDYAPLYVVESITGSNTRLINVLNTLPYTTKEDPRYLQQLQNTFNFQDAMMKIANDSKKRGIEIIK